MDRHLETRTRSAQAAVNRAREIVLRNERAIKDHQRSSGLNLTESLKTERSNLELTKNNEKQFNESNFKINTSSKLKQYLEDIINSIH